MEKHTKVLLRIGFYVVMLPLTAIFWTVCYWNCGRLEANKKVRDIFKNLVEGLLV